MGRGEVFQAFDQVGPAGHVALKVPRDPVPPSEAQLWLDSEVGPLVKLDHPNLVRALDAGCVDGVPYAATQLVDGLPLNAYVKANPPSPSRILDWMTQMADAVHYAHNRGVVHRDLKPLNVIITREGKALILDFGLASLVSAYSPEARGELGGTVQFVAPEQARGDADADHRVDVFGLGGILKFLLAGKGPYGCAPSSLAEGWAMAREGRVEFLRPGILPGTRSALCRIANRAIAPDAGRRYASALDMSRALRRTRFIRRAVPYALGLVALVAIVLTWAAFQRPALRPARAGATMQVYFQRANEVGSHRILKPSYVPLRTGDRIQIHAKLPHPLVAYLIAVSSSGTVQVLYPPEGHQPKPVNEIHVPPGKDNWLPLEPPSGTETLLLLGSPQPLPDVRAYLKTLLSHGPAPVLGDAGLLTVDDQGMRFVPPDAERKVGGKSVKADRGFLTDLVERAPKDGIVVRAIVFPHEPAPKGEHRLGEDKDKQ